MIRERGDPRYLRASIAYHAAAGVAAGLIAWPLATGRAVRVVPRPVCLAATPQAAPKRVGMTEIVSCVVLLVMVPLATS